ncbi:hypothetical protein HFN_2419 [Helicobacter fennelliae MRY12-0050]|uniref:Uncharacterized protein n=1 Tax=Helicobacter fennelliae MRY12-0050 TaxID=1325130 RepID=T1CZX9_9HELI|nr:hypothetical protein HFN_2419 [Helicobacter fennelliae MRY12-0050]
MSFLSVIQNQAVIASKVYPCVAIHRIHFVPLHHKITLRHSEACRRIQKKLKK